MGFSLDDKSGGTIARVTVGHSNKLARYFFGPLAVLAPCVACLQYVKAYYAEKIKANDYVDSRRPAESLFEIPSALLPGSDVAVTASSTEGCTPQRAIGHVRRVLFVPTNHSSEIRDVSSQTDLSALVFTPSGKQVFREGYESRFLGTDLTAATCSRDPAALPSPRTRALLTSLALCGMSAVGVVPTADSPHRVLFMGLGAGEGPCFAAFYHRLRPGALGRTRIDVVEPDRSVVEACRSWMGLPFSTTLKIADGIEVPLRGVFRDALHVVTGNPLKYPVVRQGASLSGTDLLRRKLLALSNSRAVPEENAAASNAGPTALSEQSPLMSNILRAKQARDTMVQLGEDSFVFEMGIADETSEKPPHLERVPILHQLQGLIPYLSDILTGFPILRRNSSEITFGIFRSKMLVVDPGAYDVVIVDLLGCPAEHPHSAYSGDTTPVVFADSPEALPRRLDQLLHKQRGVAAIRIDYPNSLHTQALRRGLFMNGFNTVAAFLTEDANDRWGILLATRTQHQWGQVSRDATIDNMFVRLYGHLQAFQQQFNWPFEARKAIVPPSMHVKNTKAIFYGTFGTLLNKSTQVVG